MTIQLSIVICPLFTKVNIVENLFNCYKINTEVLMRTKNTDCKAINPELVQKLSSIMPDISELDSLSDFFKVMGDLTRVRLLWALDKNELCVGDLSVLLNMTKSAVSHQLKVLKSAKLVKGIKQGKNVYYSLDDNHISTVFEMALEHLSEE